MGGFTFVEPWYLLGLLLLPGLVFLFARAKRGKRPSALVLRMVVVGLAVLALARPRWIDEIDRLGVAVLLDVSRSVPPEKRDAVLKRIERWFADLPPGDDASLILFAERPSVEKPFGALRDRQSDAGFGARLDRLESRLVTSHSNLAGAVEFAESTFPPDCAKRIVLISDGNQTKGDLEAAARALKAGGARLDVLPLVYDYAEEVVVDGLFGPGRARVDEPVALRAVISAQRSTPAEIVLIANGKPVGEPLRTTLDAGRNVVKLSPRPGDSGYYQYEVIVRAQMDGNQQNNIGRSGVLVGGEPRVLVVGDAKADDRLTPVLVESGLRASRITPAELPEHPAGYVKVDTVLLDDVPAYAISEAQQTALKDAVKELGVGLVTVGGPQSFGPGGYRGTVLAELLPVELDTTNRRTFPKGALVIVLHSIEFDSGNTWAVQICKSAIQGLSDNDEAGIAYYGNMGQDQWLFDLQSCSKRQSMYTAIDGVFPGDMPSFQPSFELAEQSLSKSDAAVKHIVVISDGDPPLPAPALMAKIVALSVTVSCICIEPHGALGSAPMRDLAKSGGGRFYELVPSLGQLSDLPRLMLKEAATLRRASISEEDFLPIVALPNSLLLRGFESGCPKLGGYVIAAPRAGAETILLANEKENDPLLAAWNIGIGRSVAFTSDAASRWAKEWLAWEGFGRFWTQVVRHVMRPTDVGGLMSSVRAEGDVLEIEADARRDDGSTPAGTKVTVVLMGSGGSTREVELAQTEPGRFSTRLPNVDSGHYLVRTRAEAPGVEPRQGLAVAAVDFAAEDRTLRSNEAFLARAAELAGGRVLKPEDGPYDRNFRAVRAQKELWPFLFFLAAGLLVVDVAARRFDFDPLRRLKAGIVARRERSAAEKAERQAANRRRELEEARAAEISRAADGAYVAAEKKVAPAKSAPAATESAKDEAAARLEALKKAKERGEKRREWQ